MYIPFSPPDIRQVDIDAVCHVLRSGWITTGPATKKFENDVASFCNATRAVALNSATAGLFLSLKIFGIGEGDEVIVPAYTFAATANVVLQVGARPVIVDINKDDFFINCDEVARHITDKTKAIITVDYGGLPIDYCKIRQIIDSSDKFTPSGTFQEKLGRILYISDSAHSFGAFYRGKRVGTGADINVFSLHAVKNLTTAEGGIVTFNNIGDISADELYKQFMLASLHGMNKDALNKYKNNSWEYDILQAGYKFNMTDVLVALGASQLLRYDEIFCRRRAISDIYKKHFDGTAIDYPLLDTDSQIGSAHLAPIRIKSCDESTRNEIIKNLLDRGVCVNVHYKPLAMFTLYKNLGFNIDDYPNSYNTYANLITLPIYTTLTDEQVDYVCQNVAECVASTVTL